MALTNLDNERGVALNLINSLEVSTGSLTTDVEALQTSVSALETDVTALETAVGNIQPAIGDAVTSAEATSPTTAEFNNLVGTVNNILSALRAYKVIQGSV